MERTSPRIGTTEATTINPRLATASRANVVATASLREGLRTFTTTA